MLDTCLNFVKLVNDRFKEGRGCDVKEIWQEVASKLDGSDILKLSATSQWFWETLMEDIIWKRAILRKVRVLDAPKTTNHATAFPWFMLYAINFGILVVV